MTRRIDDKAMTPPTALINTSLNEEDELLAFLTGWLALELFVSGGFKAWYESRWSDTRQPSAPTTTEPSFGRPEEVKSEEYHLTDKFFMIASILNAHTAEADTKTFRELKKVRDRLVHRLEIPACMPIEDTQTLTFKYMKLHLDYQNAADPNDRGRE